MNFPQNFPEEPIRLNSYYCATVHRRMLGCRYNQRDLGRLDLRDHCPVYDPSSRDTATTLQSTENRVTHSTYHCTIGYSTRD